MFVKKEKIIESNKNGKIIRRTTDLYKCDICNKEYHRRQCTVKKMKLNDLYDKDYCPNCWRKILNNRDDYKENMRKIIIKMHEENPDIAKNLSNKLKGINLGDKNAAKRPEVRAKMSRTRREKVTNDLNYRKKMSEKVKKAWEDGKFDGVSVGQCKWYEYKCSKGKAYKVQGKWELAYIEWLDKNNYNFKAHRGRIPYKLDEINKNYYPDFWVDEFNSYVEIKCKHFYLKEKFDAIKEHNPKMKLMILFKEDLLKLGIKI